MATVEQSLNREGFINWIKAYLAMRSTKNGLESFVQEDLDQFIKGLLQKVYSDHDVKDDLICTSCTTANILHCKTKGFCTLYGHCKVHDPTVPITKLGHCPKKICHHIREGIRETHRFSGPTWTNTDATKWCTSWIEIAKCYTASGYKDKSDLDLNAIISVIMNKKGFEAKMKAEINSKEEREKIRREVLVLGNKIRHSPDLNVSKTDLNAYINGLMNILSDEAYLAQDHKAINAVAELKEYSAGNFVISQEQRNDALDDAIKNLNGNTGNDSEKTYCHENSKTDSIQFASGVIPSDNTTGLEISSKENTDVQLSKNETYTHVTTTICTEGKSIEKRSNIEVSSHDNTYKEYSRYIYKREVSATDKHVSDDTSDNDFTFTISTDERSAVNKSDENVLTANNTDTQKSANLSPVNVPATRYTNDKHTVTEERNQKVIQIFNEIKIEYADKGSISISHLDTFLKARLTALEIEMTKAKDKHLSDLRKETKDIINERDKLPAVSGLNVWNKFWRGRGFREDLAKFYRGRYSTMSISPMVAEHDVPLIDLYVQPALEYVEVTNILEGAPADLKINSYDDLFFCKPSSYKEIYVTAKAGIGKTSFAKRICMAWCQAHIPLNHLKNSFSLKDIDTMKEFDYLFMIPLKETKTEECNIDAMIFHLVENKMKLKELYPVSFINELLLKKRVLVILDGLDEWAHPSQCQQKKEVIPHRLPCSNCSVITTTRPWKLASAKLSYSQINMHAELHELDDISSNRLVCSAVKLLNQRHKKSKSAEDFQKEVPLELLGALRFIPYILLQVICLWYDNLSIGNSQCAIYSNALELTLSRGNHTKITEEAKNKALPACLSMNTSCRNRYKMLINLGKLAYEAFISRARESTLLFDEDIVKQCLSEEDLQYILKIGLLSQNKDSSIVASWKTYFTFQHKSIQEYFAALYIQAYPENKSITDKMHLVYTTIESILEMSNLFIFLGGLNPDVCGRIIQEFKTIFSSDAMCCQYRNYLSGRTTSPENRKCWEIVKSFQSMQIDILQEASRNGSGHCHLYIEDLVLDESLKNERLDQLVVIVKENIDNLKSLSMEQSPSHEDVTRKLEKFELHNSKDLQKLDVTAVPSEDELHSLLSKSEQTIVSLDVCFAIFRNNRYKTEYTKLLPKTVDTLLRMGNLQSVRLNSIILEHGDFEKLVDYINGKKQMTEVGLCHIRCSKHDACVMLDISEHANLETLRIGSIPVLLLKLNASSLKFCYTGELLDAVHIELSQRLPQAVNLKTLRLKLLTGDQPIFYIPKTLAKMAQLKSFSIECAEIVGIEFTIPPEMSNLERIHLYQVTLKVSVLKQFIKSVVNLHQRVLVIIDDCTIVSSLLTSYEGVKKGVRKKHRVLFDKGKTFSFITRKQ